MQVATLKSIFDVDVIHLSDVVHFSLHVAFERFEKSVVDEIDFDENDDVSAH